MHLRVESATEYAYEHAPRRSTQYLRMTPASASGQSVIDWTLTVPGRLTPWTDMFGNHCHSLTLNKAADRLRISVSGQVETKDVSGIAGKEPGPLPLPIYLRPSDYARPDKALKSYSEEFRRTLHKDRLAGLHDLMTGIHSKVAYDEGASTVLTTASEAFAAGRGVCQDHAHILIACARRLSVPARYVSGYLWTGAHGEMFSASHAWVECWVDGLGWISFDPANGVSASDAYIRVAIGFDYATASPVRGVRVGGGTEAMSVEVRLFQEDDAASAAKAQHQAQQ